jgi:hypothetical protein
VLPRETRRLDGADLPVRPPDRPERIAADAVHVRVDDGNGGGRRDDCFQRVAAFSEDGTASLDRCRMADGDGGG